MQDPFDPIASFVSEVKGTTTFLGRLIFPIPSIVVVVLILGGILAARVFFS